MRYWHRITITITPQAERWIWESAASAPGALSHTYTSLQTHSSLFDIVNCRLMGAATACGNAASCVCVCAWVQANKREASRNNGSTLRLIAPLTYSHTAAMCKYEKFKHSVCAAVCVCVWCWRVEWWAACGLLRDEVTCQGKRDGRPDVMWHQLPLCHFVFSGGGFRGSAKRCLPAPPNTMLTLMLDSPPTHTQRCEEGIPKSFGNYVKTCVKKQPLYFHYLWNVPYVLFENGILLLTQCWYLAFAGAFRCFKSIACMNHFENKRGSLVLRFLAHLSLSLSLFSSLSPSSPLSTRSLLLVTRAAL